MGESDGRTINTDWSPEPKSAAQHKADLREATRQKQTLDELSLRIFPAAKGTGKQRPTRRGRASVSRTRQFSALISQAARDAANNQQFCEFLERDHVPVSTAPATWGIRRWSDALKDKKTSAKLRSFKSRNR